jgi:hypothetical protein
MERKLQNDRKRQIELMENAEERTTAYARRWIAQPDVKASLQGMRYEVDGFRRETKRIRLA